VYSARYAGENATYADNVNKLLGALSGNPVRSAKFRTVIALILDNKEYLFEGQVDGEILTDQRGNTGFGYDPIFRPLESEKSFAEMSAEEKNVISHRGRAVAKLSDFLDQKQNKSGGHLLL
jgi:XTP/dITP diphosphohydrolase